MDRPYTYKILDYTEGHASVQVEYKCDGKVTVLRSIPLSFDIPSGELEALIHAQVAVYAPWDIWVADTIVRKPVIDTMKGRVFSGVLPEPVITPIQEPVISEPGPVYQDELVLWEQELNA
jgi:hypothetical protein